VKVSFGLKPHSGWAGCPNHSKVPRIGDTSANSRGRPLMKIADQTSDRLIVEAGDPAFARILLALALVCACVTAVMFFVVPQAWRAESFQGVALAAVLFVIGYLAVFERATFIFDRAARTLTWRRRRAFATRSGLVPFQQIREVVLQTSMSAGVVNPKRRVALLLLGEELPLSVGYAPDVSGSAHALAETIRKVLGIPPDL